MSNETPQHYFKELNGSQDLTAALAAEIFAVFHDQPGLYLDAIVHLTKEQHTVTIRPNGSVWPTKDRNPKVQGSPTFRKEVKRGFGVDAQYARFITTEKHAQALIETIQEYSDLGLQSLIKMVSNPTLLSHNQLSDLVSLYVFEVQNASGLAVQTHSKIKNEMRTLDNDTLQNKLLEFSTDIVLHPERVLTFLYHHLSPDDWSRLKVIIFQKKFRTPASERRTVEMTVSEPILSTENLHTFAAQIMSAHLPRLLTSLNFILSTEEFTQLIRKFGTHKIQSQENLADEVHKINNTLMSVIERSKKMTALIDTDKILENPVGFIQSLFLTSERTQRMLLRVFLNIQKTLDQTAQHAKKTIQ